MGRPAIQHQIKNGVEVKYCPKCDDWKSLNLFFKSKNRWDGLAGICSFCHSSGHMKWRKAHEDQWKAYMQHYLKDNKEKISKTHKTWVFTHIDQYRATQNAWISKKLKSDPIYRLKHYFKTSLREAIKGIKLNKALLSYLPYSIKELKLHLESQFDSNMSWDNYGKYWHVDHIVTQSVFVFASLGDIEFKMCWDILNLRPLEKITNLSKQDFVTPEVLDKLQELNIKYHYNKEVVHAA